MFTRRQTVEEKFSQFLDDHQNWQPDRELQREMRKLMQQYPHQNEEFFFEYFLRKVQEQKCLRSRRHLFAYLEEICYLCARAVANKFNVFPAWREYFQDSRVEAGDIGKFWRRYELDRSHPLSYASTKLDRFLTEKIFADRQDQATSGYGWLGRITERRLRKVLENLSETKRSQYLLVWSKFKTMRPHLLRIRRVIQSPTPEQFAEIAQHCSSSGYDLNPSQVEEILKTCIAALDRTRPQTEISIDARSGKEDDLENQQIDDALLFESDISEISGNTPEQSRIISVLLGGSIAYLDSPIEKLSKKISPGLTRKLLFLEYGLLGVGQKVIGEAVGLKQFEVSRQLTRIKTCLIKELVALAKQHPRINLDTDYIDSLGDQIDNLLTWYCRQVVYKELEYGLRSYPQISSEIDTLAIYFGQLSHDWTKKLLLIRWTPAELDKHLEKAQKHISKKLPLAAQKLQISEQQLLDKVNNLTAEFIEYISTHFGNKFCLNVEIISKIKECLERMIYAFLHTCSLHKLLVVN